MLKKFINYNLIHQLLDFLKSDHKFHYFLFFGLRSLKIRK